MQDLQTETAQPQIHLQGFTYAERASLLPELGAAIDAAGGWVLDRRSISAGAVELHVEVQLQALPEVYGALLATGLQLTRDSHRALAERCNCSMHLRPRRGVSSLLLIHAEVHFLSGPTHPLDLSRLLLMGVATA